MRKASLAPSSNTQKASTTSLFGSMDSTTSHNSFSKRKYKEMPLDSQVKGHFLYLKTQVLAVTEQ